MTRNELPFRRTTQVFRTILIFTTLFMAGPSGFAGEELTLTFSTTPAGGKYKPQHVLAVWVVDGDGKLVKSLALLGRKRTKHLTDWKAADGGKVDGWTGATRKTHAPCTVTWNLRNRRGEEVAPGTYRILLEMTDDNAKKKKFHRSSLTFQKDGKSRRQQIGSRDGFKGIVLDYVVTSTSAGRP